jgi:hypothetical protein
MIDYKDNFNLTLYVEMITQTKMDSIMANVIDFDLIKKNEQPEQVAARDSHPSELGAAIQSLIQQLRKAPLQRIG